MRYEQASGGSRAGLSSDFLVTELVDDAQAAYDHREEELGDELMRALERYLLLQIIDQRWREHLYNMDYLREGIHLRGFAQIDPLVAYKNEGYSMFEELMHSVWEEFARLIFHVQVDVAPAQAQEQFAAQDEQRRVQYSGGGQEQPSALTQAGTASGAAETAGADALAAAVWVAFGAGGRSRGARAGAAPN